MKELNLSQICDILAKAAPNVALLKLDSSDFELSEAMRNLFELKELGAHSFKATLGNWLGNEDYLERMMTAALQTQAEQKSLVTLDSAHQPKAYMLRVSCIAMDDSHLMIIVLEDQSRIQWERQALERLNWLSEQLLKQVSGGYLKTEAIYESACKMSVLLIGKSDMGSFVRLQEGFLTWPTLIGYSDSDRKSEKLRYEESLQWIIGKDAPNEILRIDDLNDLPEILPLMFERSSSARTRSMLSAPVHLDGVIFGYINVDSTQPRCFDDFDLWLFKAFAQIVELALERNQLLIKVQELETRDRQTGLKSLPLAELRVYDLLSKGGGEEALGLVLVDLMGLKIINDRYGWDLGNEAIIATGKRIADFETDYCEAYRLSADQFLLVVLGGSAFEETCRQLDQTLKHFYAEGAHLSKGRIHIPVIYVTEYINGNFGSLREILGVLRQKMKVEKTAWRLKMPIF